MTRRGVVALLGRVAWTPPGIDPADWRSALAEDVVDLLATLDQVRPAIAATAADLDLAQRIAWPGMTVYRLADHPDAPVNAVLSAAAADGCDQVAVLAADAPDLPALTVGKLLRPLTSRPVAVAAPPDGAGLLGVAVRLPAPPWLPAIDLDTTTLDAIRTAAPRRADVAVASGWRRLRGPADLSSLDPAVEGWEHTRILLSPS
ncbi:MAG TPA: hypothetical protein VF174_00725 [Micromonosporaceae bacterium]